MKRLLTILLLVLFLTCSVFAESNVKTYSQSKKYSHHQTKPRYVIITPDKSKFLVNLFIDRGTGGIYQDGENIKIRVKSDETCYIYLFSLDFENNINLIYPNYKYQNNRIYADKMTELKPGHGQTYQVGGQGMQILFALATTQRFEFFRKGKKGLSYHSKFKSNEEFRRYYSIPEGMETIEDFFYGVSEYLLSELPEQSWSSAIEVFFIQSDYVGQTPVNSVEVDCQPATTVYLDNINFGYSPVTITEVPEGEHVLYLQAGNREYTREFYLTGNNNRVIFNVALGSGQVSYPQPPVTVPHPPVMPDDYIVSDIFRMTDGRQEFEREIEPGMNLVIKSVWSLMEDIQEVHSEVEVRGKKDVRIFKMNFFMNDQPYQGQKFVKTVYGYKYVIIMEDFSWQNNDPDSGVMDYINFRILVQKVE